MQKKNMLTRDFFIYVDKHNEVMSADVATKQACSRTPGELQAGGSPAPRLCYDDAPVIWILHHIHTTAVDCVVLLKETFQQGVCDMTHIWFPEGHFMHKYNT